MSTIHAFGLFIYLYYLEEKTVRNINMWVNTTNWLKKNTPCYCANYNHLFQLIHNKLNREV